MRDPFSLRTTSNTGVKTLILTIFVTFFYKLFAITCNLLYIYFVFITNI